MKSASNLILAAAVVLVCIPSLLIASSDDDDADDEDPYKTTDPKKREPSPCEICKYFVTELKSRLAETDKSKEVIETGHGLDRKKKRFKYHTSELRLTEALHEPHICENILTYNVHAERKGSLRYAKGMSETMSTLHGLVNKGVKVELGIPHELWDKPSAEVSKMHRACFTFAERFEDVVEDWYYNLQDSEVDLMKYLCAERYLKDKDQACLQEVFQPKGDDGDDESEKKKKKKKKKSGKKKKDKSRPAADSSDDNVATSSPTDTADTPTSDPLVDPTPDVTAPPTADHAVEPDVIPTPPTTTPSGAGGERDFEESRRKGDTSDVKEEL